MEVLQGPCAQGDEGQVRNAAESGRKALKVSRGKILADADLVITMCFKEVIAFYLPDEGRWMVSFPQQRHDRVQKKDGATDERFKRTICVFKSAPKRLAQKETHTEGDVPSYFIECLLYNVPDSLFKPKLAPNSAGIIDWLKREEPKDFECQNGRSDLFGSGKDQCSQKKERTFVRSLQRTWEAEGLRIELSRLVRHPVGHTAGR